MQTYMALSGGTSTGNVVWQVRPGGRLIGSPRVRSAPCRGVWGYALPDNFVILDFFSGALFK